MTCRPSWRPSSPARASARCASGAWQQLTTNNASQVAADSIGDVVAEFPGQGVWLCTPDSAWQQLTANNATSLDVAFCRFGDTSGKANGVLGVVAEFPGQGLWRASPRGYGVPARAGMSGSPVDGSTLTANDAATEAIDQKGIVAAAFPGAGVLALPGQHRLATDSPPRTPPAWPCVPLWTAPVLWRPSSPATGCRRFRDSSGWQQLTANDAVTLGIDPSGDVVGTFPGTGSGASPTPLPRPQPAGTPAGTSLTAANATMVGIDANGNAYGQFNGWGVWYDQVYSWQLLTASNASSLGVGG